MNEASEFFGISSKLVNFCIEEGCSLDGTKYREDPIQWYNTANPHHVKPSWK